jgi:hypothetical protein
MGPLHLAASTSLHHPMVPAINGRQPRSRTGARAAAVERGTQAVSVAVDEVPVLDLAELRSCGHGQGTQRVAAACRDWGFFQVHVPQLASLSNLLCQFGPVVNGR